MLFASIVRCSVAWTIAPSATARMELVCAGSYDGVAATSDEPTELAPRSLLVSDWSATSEQVTEGRPRYLW